MVLFEQKLKMMTGLATRYTEGITERAKKNTMLYIRVVLKLFLPAHVFSFSGYFVLYSHPLEIFKALGG